MLKSDVCLFIIELQQNNEMYFVKIGFLLKFPAFPYAIIEVS